MGRRFFILDVFAEQKYSGNQLAVVRDGSGLTAEEMLSITREMNYSETTFLTSELKQNGGYDVRIFTPGEEIPFAGHPTLGTAWLIQQEVIGEPVNRVLLNYPVGQIPVDFTYSKGKPHELWMRQPEPKFGPTFEPTQVASVLDLKPDQVQSGYPCQIVSTGLPFLIAPLKDMAAVDACRVDPQRLLALLEHTAAKCVLVFCPQALHCENNLHVRVFCHHLGIPEDPATGSANGCLAGYLAQHEYFGGPLVNVRVEQGYAVNRPSLLLLKAHKTADSVNVRVGGKVILVAEGVLL